MYIPLLHLTNTNSKFTLTLSVEPVYELSTSQKIIILIFHLLHIFTDTLTFIFKISIELVF